MVVASGLVASWVHLDRFSDLWTTAYGQMLFRKLVFVALTLTEDNQVFRLDCIRRIGPPELSAPVDLAPALPEALSPAFSSNTTLAGRSEDPTHPAILRLIRNCVEAAHNNNIWCGICGEMAGDPVLTPLLIGLGLDELSVAPPSIPQIKYLVRRCKLDEAKELAAFAFSCEDSKEILARLESYVREIAPSLFEDRRCRPTLGGAIAPGIGIAMEALVGRTAQLYKVTLQPPPDPVGRNTAHALQSGLFWGYVGLVEGLVARLKAAMPGGTDAKVIATGGLASLFREHTTVIEEIAPFLTLDGLRIIYDLNQS